MRKSKDEDWRKEKWTRVPNFNLLIDKLILEFSFVGCT